MLPTHFPAGDPAVHARSLPYARALGLRWQAPATGQACLRLPYGAQVRAPLRGAIHAGAALGLIDQCCSAAVYVGLRQAAPIATLDLRVEFAAEAGLRSDLVCTATATHLDASAALVRAEMVCADTGRLLACASSAYAIGSHPGLRTGAPVRQAVEADLAAIEAERHEGFDQLLDLRRHGQGWRLPFQPRLVGAASLPSLHGGVIAAALAAAAHGLAADAPADRSLPRLLTFSVRYLRAAGTEALDLQARAHKRGARATFIGACATQGLPSRTVAQAECLFAGLPTTPSTGTTT